jgi:transposase InsO family protein
MKIRKNKNKVVSRGRRYSPAERAQILEDAQEMGVSDAAEKHRCSKWTIYDWRKQDKRRAARAEAEALRAEGGASCAGGITTELAGEPGPSQEATRQEERHELILELWRQQPGLGPSQIRNQLKRKGFKASVSTVRAIMEEHGYVQPKARRKEHTGEYEAVRPLQLYHLDFLHFFVHRQKQCMLLMIDDYSRFIAGWTLLRSEHADGVIEAFDASVARYGTPEAVMTDRGAGFHSWRGLSRFERLLEEHGIDHYLATEPQVNGKAEALVATVKKELIGQTEFADLTEARFQADRWVQFYNYKRTHHALGGLLVPADRFHGWQEETLKRIEQGNGADMLDLLSPETRGLELFKVVSVGGQPAVYLMGRKVLG